MKDFDLWRYAIVACRKTPLDTFSIPKNAATGKKNKKKGGKA
jgi:hypothetical protein